jgi:hypothetical protein
MTTLQHRLIIYEIFSVTIITKREYFESTHVSTFFLKRWTRPSGQNGVVCCITVLNGTPIISLVTF